MTEQVQLVQAPELRICPRHGDATLQLLLHCNGYYGRVIFRASPLTGITVHMYVST